MADPDWDFYTEADDALWEAEKAHHERLVLLRTFLLVGTVVIYFVAQIVRWAW